MENRVFEELRQSLAINCVTRQIRGFQCGMLFEEQVRLFRGGAIGHRGGCGRQLRLDEADDVRRTFLSMELPENAGLRELVRARIDQRLMDADSEGADDFVARLHLCETGCR